MADWRSVLVIFFLVCMVAGTTTPTTPKSTVSTTTNTTAKTPTSTMAPTTPTVEEQCEKHNKSCEKCVSNSKCLYCKSSNWCMKYPGSEIIPRSSDCALSDARWGVCWVNFEALLIAMGVIGGVILITISVCCAYCCCCRNKKRRYEKDDARYEQQSMDRKVKQDERRTERKGRLDEIRRKYGLVKEDSPYNRFDTA